MKYKIGKREIKYMVAGLAAFTAGTILIGIYTSWWVAFGVYLVGWGMSIVRKA